MSSRSDARLRLGAFVALLALLAPLAVGVATAFAAPRSRPAADRPPAHTLRVCADPNNMPFSSRDRRGFENRIADILARDLGDTVAYTWWPQRRGWVRNTLNARQCDVALGVPAGYDMVLTTQPYYRSSYVFVSRADRRYDLHSLDDPRLRSLRIGLHFIGDDYTNPPPAHALGARGITRNVVGYSIYGDYREPNPPARLIEAVEHGDVDVALAWGPLAGYFAKQSRVPLTVTPVAPAVDRRSGMAFTFPIAVGVRKGDTALRDTLQRALVRNAAAIRGVLAEYGIPTVGGR